MVATRPSPDGGDRERHAAGRRCREARRAFGPLDEDDRLVVAEAELVGVALGGQPVEVGVEDAEAAALVGLHQREGRRRHLEAGVGHQRADDRAGEGGLARTEVAREQDQVAGPQDRREPCAESCGRGVVGEDDGLRSTG